jgi:hypothetical protein
MELNLYLTRGFRSFCEDVNLSQNVCNGSHAIHYSGLLTEYLIKPSRNKNQYLRKLS